MNIPDKCPACGYAGYDGKGACVYEPIGYRTAGVCLQCGVHPWEHRIAFLEHLVQRLLDHSTNSHTRAMCVYPRHFPTESCAPKDSPPPAA